MNLVRKPNRQNSCQSYKRSNFKDSVYGAEQAILQLHGSPNTC